MSASWLVVRQSSGTQVCAHRFHLAAWWCARKWTRRTPIGQFYDFRPAVTR